MKKRIVRISIALLALVIAGIGFAAETKAQGKQEEQSHLPRGFMNLGDDPAADGAVCGGSHQYDSDEARIRESIAF